jgi:ribosomal protein S18 acetylase RimI-like enzyme
VSIKVKKLKPIRGNIRAEIKIRPLELRDKKAIFGIQEAITKYRADKDWEQLVEGYIKNSGETSLVAELDGKVVGFMLGDIKVYGFGVGRSGWIEVIGVHPRYMGGGVGKKLGNELIKIFKTKKVKHIFTSVRWDSGDLLAFFKSIGFDRSDFINLEKKI